MTVTTATMTGRDLFIRFTQKDGRTWVDQRRVWDSGIFIDSEVNRIANLKADDPLRGGRVQLASEDEYRAERSHV